MEAAAAVSYVTDVENLKATELRLGLPGTEEPAQKTAAVMPSPPSTPRGSKRTLAGDGEESAREEAKKLGGETVPPAAKAQVVGWPPVRAYRKSCFQASSKSKAAQQEETATAAPAVTAGNGGSGLYVKVSMDGAPYLRKIDLKMYKGYRELREALEAMFLCFPGGADNGGVNPSDFAVTYEDKDGDLMLVGDVPFEMFIGTCKRLRIMKGSEARGLGSSRE